MVPKRSKQWVLNETKGFDSLKLSTVSIPELGDHEVLVKFKATSLNNRDLIIAQGGNPFPIKPNVVPGSDGAGEILKVGPQVSEFKVGDRVAATFFRDHEDGDLTPTSMETALGAKIDGTFREYGVYHDHSLVRVPMNLDWLEASTLGCAGVTAWNALYGDRAVGPGNTVLVQGTGGVSLFALQFAIAAGAGVIATTSSAAKAEMLKSLGAKHVILYSEDLNWGETAKGLTQNGNGVDIVVEVGGPTSLRQSLRAIRMGGIISMIGGVGGTVMLDPPFSSFEIFGSLCTIKAVGVGNRMSFQKMNQAIEFHDIKPVIDKRVFKLDDLQEAYQYLLERKHVGKVVIEVD